jgi:periplasmic protein TonB
MKTINKKGTIPGNATQKGGRKYLLDHPDGHEMLSSSARQKLGKFVTGVIDLKSTRDKKNRSITSLLSSISLCLSLLIVIWAFEVKFPEQKIVVDLSGHSSEFEDLVDIPQTEQIQKPPVQIQAPTIVEVSNEEVIEEIKINLDIEMTEDTRIEEVIISKQTEVLPEEKADEIFTIVENQPMPKGGYKAFYDYVGANLRYPASASRMGIEGRVFVEFIVEKDGSLTDIKVVKGIGGGCDEEAVRVISGAPKWNPGKQRGNAVRVRMVMPIMFKLLS